MALACYNRQDCGGRDENGNPVYELSGSDLTKEWLKKNEDLK